MTVPPQGEPPFDQGHPGISNQYPQWLFTGKFKGPQGDLAIFTFRMPNATVTAVLDKTNAQKWIDQMQKEVDGMSSLSVVPPGVPLPPMSKNSNGRPFG